MTLTLTGRNIDYKEYKQRNGEWIIEVYDYQNKAIFKVKEAEIYDSISEPLKVTLYRYEVIPWDDTRVPEQNIQKYQSVIPVMFLQKPNNKKLEKGCRNCANHNYDYYPNDGYGGEEFEICEKGNDLDGPCDDWEEL